MMLISDASLVILLIWYEEGTANRYSCSALGMIRFSLLYRCVVSHRIITISIVNNVR